MQQYDIVIIGAGPVGLATAALLAVSPAAKMLRIRVLDGGDPPDWREDDTDLRVYALSSTSLDVLTRAGALRGIADRRMSPYEHMRVWEGTTAAAAAPLCFDSADIGEAVLGHIVEDRLIRLALCEALEREAAVTLEFARRVESIDFAEREVRLSLEDDAVPIKASLLIGADGARSRVREAAQLDTTERDYGQHAIVAHVRSQKPHRRTAWQRFLPGGPLALLPLADGRSSFVWSLPRDEAQQWMAAAPEKFSQRLTRASGAVLGELHLDSDRAALPLAARHTHSYCRPRLVLAGDAAHSVHPLAGQGVNLGLADASELAQQISNAVIEGQDPGDLRVLQRYERARKGANLLMLGAFDGLDRLFRAPRMLAPLRIAGLRLVDAIPIVKNRLIRHAAGDPRS